MPPVSQVERGHRHDADHHDVARHHGHHGKAPGRISEKWAEERTSRWSVLHLAHATCHNKRVGTKEAHD